MVTLGEMLSLATPRSAIMGKMRLLWVFISLENAFATIAGLKMLSGTDGHTKPQMSLYLILLTRNSIPFKITFLWLHLHLELSQNFQL